MPKFSDGHGNYKHFKKERFTVEFFDRKLIYFFKNLSESLFCKILNKEQ
jgi:hypothetical protein